MCHYFPKAVEAAESFNFVGVNLKLHGIAGLASRQALFLLPASEVERRANVRGSMHRVEVRALGKPRTVAGSQPAADCLASFAPASFLSSFWGDLENALFLRCYLAQFSWSFFFSCSFLSSLF